MRPLSSPRGEEDGGVFAWELPLEDSKELPQSQSSSAAWPRSSELEMLAAVAGAFRAPLNFCSSSAASLTIEEARLMRREDRERDGVGREFQQKEIRYLQIFFA